MKKLFIFALIGVSGFLGYSYLFGGYALVEDTSPAYNSPRALWVGYSAGQCHREKIKMLVKQPGWWTYDCVKVPFGTAPGRYADASRYIAPAIF